MTQFSKKKIISQKSGSGGTTPSDAARITKLENNVYKITYYEIITGTGGSLTIPTGATINSGEFGLSGNSILSKINGSNKPTYESPKTAGEVVVTANLATNGTWTTSGTYTDGSVALIYSLNISALNYSNLNSFYIIETVELTDFPISQVITNGVVDKVPSEDAVFDALALKKDNIVVTTARGAISPSDSTTYYYFQSISPTVTASPQIIKLGFNFKIVGALFVVGNNTVSGSAENNTVNFYNDTTATASLLSNSVKTNGSTTSVVTSTVSGLNITGLATDDVCLQWVTPIYATNPTNVLIRVSLLIEKTS